MKKMEPIDLLMKFHNIRLRLLNKEYEYEEYLGLCSEYQMTWTMYEIAEEHGMNAAMAFKLSGGNMETWKNK